MTVSPNRIVKSLDILDIFKYETVCLLKVMNSEAIQPFSFDQGVERFNAGVVPRISLLRIAALHFCCRFSIFGSYILAATV